MLDLADFGRNPHAEEFGNRGVCYVRHGKAMKGSPPKRRSVLTVWAWTVDVLEEWVEEIRPCFGRSGSRALWPSESGDRIGLSVLDGRFATVRDELGLDSALDFHSLRRGPVAVHRTCTRQTPLRPRSGQPPAGANHLRGPGIPLRLARVAAVRHLVLEVPAPVVAQALGFHHTTTHRQNTHAGGTWNRYVATRPER